jgi:Uma2 family endonuclease
MTVRQGITVAEYLALPERKPWLEFDDGELHHMDGHDWPAMKVCSNLMGLLRDLPGDYGHRPRIGLKRDGVPVRYYLPDIGYWLPNRPIRGPVVMHPVSAAIEVLDTYESLDPLRRKCAHYIEGGVEAAWLIDPVGRTVEMFDGHVHALEWREPMLTHPLIPGFQLSVERIFEGLADEPVYD